MANRWGKVEVWQVLFYWAPKSLQTMSAAMKLKIACQPRCPSTDAWIKKLWYIYTMEYCSAIKRNDAHELFLMRGTNLEPIVQSEVSQRNINIIYWHIYIWTLKRWYWWIYFQGISGETDIENRPMDMGGGEEGEDEMYGESNMETYNTICKIDSQ